MGDMSTDGPSVVGEGLRDGVGVGGVRFVWDMDGEEGAVVIVFWWSGRCAIGCCFFLSFGEGLS